MHRSRTEGWPGEVEDSGLPRRSKKNGKTMKLENLKDRAVRCGPEQNTSSCTQGDLVCGRWCAYLTQRVYESHPPLNSTKSYGRIKG